MPHVPVLKLSLETEGQLLGIRDARWREQGEAEKGKAKSPLMKAYEPRCTRFRCLIGFVQALSKCGSLESTENFSTWI